MDSDFQRAVEADFLELQQRILARHHHSLKELDKAWNSGCSVGDTSRGCAPAVRRVHSESQKPILHNGLDWLPLESSDACLQMNKINSVQAQGLSPQSVNAISESHLPSQLVQGLQRLESHSNHQSHALEMFSEKIDRATCRMGLQSLRLQEHRDNFHSHGTQSGSRSTVSWVSEAAEMSRFSDAGYTLHTDFRLHPAWRRPPKVKTPVSVIRHRTYYRYHQRLLNAIDMLETESQVGRKHCVIGPDSRYRLAWEVIGMFFLTFDLVVVPLLVFQPQSSMPFKIADWVMLIFWTIDIIMSFRLAHYTKHGQLQIHLRAIAVHYCRRWFVFDFMILSIDWVLIVGDPGKGRGVLKSAKMMRGLRFLRIFRLLRIVKITHFVNAMRLRITNQYAYVVTGIMEYLAMLILVNHLIACTWFWIGNSAGSPNWVDKYGLRNANVSHKYIVSLHWSLTQFTPASMQVQPQNAGEQLFAVLVLVLALVVFGSLISSITVAMTALRSVNFKKADQFWLLRKYLRQHSISDDLTMHVTRYLTIAVDRQLARIQEDQVQLLALLSAPLRVRLKNELFSKLLVVHPLFERMHVRCLSVIDMICCSAIHEDHLSREDVLFHCGEAAKKMYFVEEGRLAYLREKHNMQLCSHGEWCSEVSLWCPWVHRGDMHARTDCTVLALDSEQFREVVLSFPADLWLPRRYGKAFCKQLREMSVCTRSVTESIGPDDIQVGNLDLKMILNSITKTAHSQDDKTRSRNEDEESDSDGDGLLNNLEMDKADTTQRESDRLRLPTTTICLDSIEDVDSMGTGSKHAISCGLEARAAHSRKSACTVGFHVPAASFASIEDDHACTDSVAVASAAPPAHASTKDTADV